MSPETVVKHKFQADSNMTFQEVFDFAFKRMIPILQGAARELGQDQVYEALKNAAAEFVRNAAQETARQLPCNDFAAWNAWGSEPSYFGDHILTKETVEDTPEACELRVTECLWATTFREMGAEDLGYLLFCNSDYAQCQGFNPRIRLVRTKTLMQGDDCCNHRFVWE